jgi:hypothetical protein
MNSPLKSILRNIPEKALSQPEMLNTTPETDLGMTNLTRHDRALLIRDFVALGHEPGRFRLNVDVFWMVTLEAFLESTLQKLSSFITDALHNKLECLSC